MSESICTEFTLGSNGLVRQLFPEMMGDYLLQTVRNNGRNVYKHNKEVVYLYSLNVYEHADDADYETLKDWAGTWVVSIIKYYIIL